MPTTWVTGAPGHSDPTRQLAWGVTRSLHTPSAATYDHSSFLSSLPHRISACTLLLVNGCHGLLMGASPPPAPGGNGQANPTHVCQGSARRWRRSGHNGGLNSRRDHGRRGQQERERARKAHQQTQPKTLRSKEEREGFHELTEPVARRLRVTACAGWHSFAAHPVIALPKEDRRPYAADVADTDSGATRSWGSTAHATTGPGSPDRSHHVHAPASDTHFRIGANSAALLLAPPLGRGLSRNPALHNIYVDLSHAQQHLPRDRPVPTRGARGDASSY